MPIFICRIKTSAKEIQWELLGETYSNLSPQYASHQRARKLRLREMRSAISLIFLKLWNGYVVYCSFWCSNHLTFEGCLLQTLFQLLFKMSNNIQIRTFQKSQIFFFFFSFLLLVILDVISCVSGVFVRLEIRQLWLSFLTLGSIFHSKISCYFEISLHLPWVQKHPCAGFSKAAPEHNWAPLFISVLVHVHTVQGAFCWYPFVKVYEKGTHIHTHHKNTVPKASKLTNFHFGISHTHQFKVISMTAECCFFSCTPTQRAKMCIRQQISKRWPHGTDCLSLKEIKSLRGWNPHKDSNCLLMTSNKAEKMAAKPDRSKSTKESLEVLKFQVWLALSGNNLIARRSERWPQNTMFAFYMWQYADRMILHWVWKRTLTLKERK